jgi:hypothetical protein
MYKREGGITLKSEICNCINIIFHKVRALHWQISHVLFIRREYLRIVIRRADSYLDMEHNSCMINAGLLSLQ